MAKNMERSAILRSRWLVALETALLTVVSAVVVTVASVQAQAPELKNGAPPQLKNVGVINVIGARASATAPFYIEGEPFGSGVYKPIGSPVSGSTFSTIPGVPQVGFGGATCNTEFRQAEIVNSKGSLTFNLVDYHCLQPSGASTTNGLYDIIGGTGKYADFAVGGGIFSIDERANGQAFLAYSGMHCPPPPRNCGSAK